MIHEEKERERMGIELNEQREKMNSTQLVGFRCVSVKILLYFFVVVVFCCFSLFFVRVTVRAGASLSLTCVREASKRQLPVN